MGACNLTSMMICHYGNTHMMHAAIFSIVSYMHVFIYKIFKICYL